ncbi:MAG: hypothetical protein K0S33_3045 [Bacteroidetes bacterium]|jgi:hypothetical protein|nr:hypothetical protein [Bacteroidota bacterium]
MSKPIVNKKIRLEKYPGKGGWTYVVIDEIAPDKREKFGWVQVKGSIDGFELKQYKLMPMGNGCLFLPVRAEIRKKIKKQAGDIVHVILDIDHSTLEVPEEFMACLEDDPKAKKFFLTLTDSEKRLYILWIYSAKREETRVSRIANSINRLGKGQKLYEPAK